MYLSNRDLLRLKQGDYICYWDLNGIFHKLKFLHCKRLVNSIRNLPASPQQQFEDERGATVHIPVNVWEFTGVRPYDAV